VSEETNRNLPARNTLVQLLAPRATVQGVTDRQTDRRTDDMMTQIANHTV